MKITVLYEDTDILAINKPAGISVHGDGKTKENTVADWFAENYPKSKNIGEHFEVEIKGKKSKILRSGIVHRIDKETSGVLLLAKNQKAYDFLKKQFQDHKIMKTYKAFAYGRVPNKVVSLASGKRGRITAPIGRSPKDIRMWTAGRGARDPVREALTEYNVIAHFSDNDKKNENQEHQFSYVEVYPKTGRTHQIRVHFRYINHPLVSDPLYRNSQEKALGMKRLALHAYKINFLNLKGEKVEIVANLPTDFKKILKEYNITDK